MLKYETKYTTVGEVKWVRYYLYGAIHRIYNAAALRSSGTIFWYEYGIPHRKVGPASIYSTGTYEYRKRGRYVEI
jgi:hypothetical protein